MKTNKIIALTSLVLYVPFCAVVYPRMARGEEVSIELTNKSDRVLGKINPFWLPPMWDSFGNRILFEKPTNMRVPNDVITAESAVLAVNKATLIPQELNTLYTNGPHRTNIFLSVSNTCVMLIRSSTGCEAYGNYTVIIGGRNLTNGVDRQVMLGELQWTNLTSHVTLPQPVWEVTTNWTEVLASQTGNNGSFGSGYTSFGFETEYEILGESGQIVSNLVLTVIYKGVSKPVTLDTQKGPVLKRSFESQEIIHHEDGTTTTNRVPSRSRRVKNIMFNSIPL